MAFTKWTSSKCDTRRTPSLLSNLRIHFSGVGTPVQLRTFPQLVEFGSIPFAIPQKRFMLLMNPLAVPITLQVQTTEDGEEQPLVFNIREPSKILPITIKDPIKELQFAKEDMMADPEPECNIEFTTREPEEQSIHSVSINESVYSVDFEENVLGESQKFKANSSDLCLSNITYCRTDTGNSRASVANSEEAKDLRQNRDRQTRYPRGTGESAEHQLFQHLQQAQPLHFHGLARHTQRSQRDLLRQRDHLSATEYGTQHYHSAHTKQTRLLSSLPDRAHLSSVAPDLHRIQRRSTVQVADQVGIDVLKALVRVQLLCPRHRMG